MRHSYVTREKLFDFIHRLDDAFARPGSLYLIGETTQVFEGWREWTTQVEFTAVVPPADQDHFARMLADVKEQFGVNVFDEFPGDVIPLPQGYDQRARPVSSSPFDVTVARHLSLYHFDPCSVAFRFVARGDEPDYHLVLVYVERGWLSVDEMDARLADLLPRFSMRTIQQDPAEFRRKYDGLLQMLRAVPARTTHRPTPV
jgi:hypothetical protein